MILVLLLTMLVVAIPTLYVFNARSVQRIALFIGATQVVVLAFSGKIDESLSDYIVAASNHLISASYAVMLDKMVCLLNMFSI
ncbi:MAG TPA: hypothetical protein PK355_09765 [Chitinophagales bacterium]|nr:hypothetical protein [Chitinophagales bacterium]